MMQATFVLMFIFLFYLNMTRQLDQKLKAAYTLNIFNHLVLLANLRLSLMCNLALVLEQCSNLILLFALD